MDPLPPPTTVSARALQRGSRSGSSASSRPGSRSPSTAPEVSAERSTSSIDVSIDEPNAETRRPLSRNGSRERTAACKEEGGTAGTRPPSRSPETDVRPPKRRRLSLAGAVATEPSSPPPSGPGVLGPSSRPAAGAPSYPPADPPSRPEDGAIDVDALPDSPTLVPSSPPAADSPSGSQPNRAPTRSRQASLHPSSPTGAQTLSPSRPAPEPLATYVCPICFSPPTNPTMAPCGHVCCGECLFSAVKSTIERSAYHGPASQRAKCPVCRAPIPGWDGRGRGVIGLKPRVVHTIDGSQ
ncbi:hypothetical protein PHLGIDRAFT_125155 [Phlebiopsis gigantea 11061_1 CR5-6]|uniref:RING-type domain-containing protein n=1 Tax=Phlebiopsis gigantea (strain 11061_1 CR5-6) TaxID=745531 RepID=A0A0C3S530_PHLG1|nr:hypothetical protein PHLGIDRAFT_125155 [Phlebiopsis gigantea 11061_1 CR5-6]